MQVIKRVKNGEEVKFICSICGEVIYCMFVYTGERREVDWDKLPETCSCGAKLTKRQPIIDADNIDKDDISKNIHEDVHDDKRENVRGNVFGAHGIVPRSVHEKSDVYKRYMIDFENAISIDYFDMRLNGLKSGNYKVPDNIDHLMMNCINRNISYIELFIEQSSYSDDGYDKNELKDRLNVLRQRYKDISRKSEDFDKKRF